MLPSYWTLILRGGVFNGVMLYVDLDHDPGPVLVAWRCAPACAGHFAFNGDFEEIELARAVAYKMVAFNEERQVAIYGLGDLAPNDEHVVVLNTQQR